MNLLAFYAFSNLVSVDSCKICNTSGFFCLLSIYQGINLTKIL